MREMNDLTNTELEQLLAVFREQTLLIIEEMSHDLLALESGTADQDTMTRLRRAAHTIKGDSACIGLEGVMHIMHKIEDAFDAAIKGPRVAFDRRAVDVLLKTLDAVKAAIGGDQVGDVSAETTGNLVEALTFLESEPIAPDTTREPESPPDPRHALPAAIPRESKQRRNYVRVEASKIDTLLNLAGEMVIARSVIGQIGPELERAFPNNELVTRFASASGQLGKLVVELQKSMLQMRMVTIDHVFRRFARPMRELAQERGKEFELIISGGETQLDRALVDLLYEPLLHLLRNAVDHGLETTDERRNAGKPEIGRITLRAYHQGNQAVVEVSDDGRGIDPDAVKAKALQSGAITKHQSEQMSDEEALALIFLQGLSTTQEITRLSGRGIGATAVKSVVEQLRGSIAVKSEPGCGASFTLRMPLTLAIIKALLFTAAGRLFALPLLAVSEIACANEADIVYLDGIEHYRLREHFVSLVRPGVVLGFDRRKGGSGTQLRRDGAPLFLIVLTAGDKSYAVVADELIGEQELVIKPLVGDWVQSDALAGASVLGDGRVVLILDSEMIFRKAVKYERAKGNSLEAYAV